MRRKYILPGAGLLALAATVIGVSAATASGSPAAAPVPATITIDAPGQVFAPPPANAAPAMTFQAVQAANNLNPLAAASTVQLGLFSNPVGPDCADCTVGSGNSVHNGVIYSAYQELAYGVSTSLCPAGSAKPAYDCTEWEFYDAATGAFIAGMEPQFATYPNASPTPSPSATAAG